MTSSFGTPTYYGLSKVFDSLSLNPESKAVISEDKFKELRANFHHFAETVHFRNGMIKRLEDTDSLE